MKTLFTLCLIPVAFVGAGMVAGISVRLIKIGWRLGGEVFEHLNIAPESLLGRILAGRGKPKS